VSPQNLIEGTSEKIVEIKGVEHHTTDGWRACIYILGKLKKTNFIQISQKCLNERACKMLRVGLIHFLPLGKKEPSILDMP
jgi:hypothetical protein